MFENKKQNIKSRGILTEESSDSSLSSSSVDDFEIVGYNNENENMSDEEVLWNSSINPTNKNDIRYKYLGSSSAMHINKALRNLPNFETLDSKLKRYIKSTMKIHGKTISQLDEATRSNIFIKNKYLYRMVRFDYLENNFGISVEPDEELDTVLNKIYSNCDLQNMSIIEHGFTSCSYKEFGSEYFTSYPVELIIRCKPGDTYYQTDNYKEAELVLPRDITFGILEKPTIVDTPHGKKLKLHFIERIKK